MQMKGRDRSGDDARGAIGDIDLIDFDEPDKTRTESAEKVLGILPTKFFGVGLMVIIAGIIISLWSTIDFYILYVKTEYSLGVQLIALGFFIIILAILVKLILNPILDMILR